MAEISKMQKGLAYRQQALELLARLGYATTRQLALGVHGSTTLSKRKMMGRTTRWLEALGLVVSKKQTIFGLSSVNAETIYALTSSGASLARSMGSPLVANKAHGRDYLRHEHAHRTVCNSVFCALPGRVYSELEVRSNEAPLCWISVAPTEGSAFKKIPDLIATADDNGLIWVEVENRYRSTTDLEKMISALQEMYSSRRRYNLSYALFVITDKSAKNIGARIKEKLLHAQETGISSAQRMFDKELLENFVRVIELEPDTLWLRPVTL